jgi:Pyruvate/2-oxoacid:ferredoxin oxidoreductase delta subunit
MSLKKEFLQKKIILKNALKTILDKINTKVEDIECLHSQKIDYEKCTNCQECIEFCPTDALFANQVQDTIYIQTGKCIGCEICHNICKEKAIESNNQIDLVEFAFDKAKALVEFEIRSCTECKLSFPYKGKEEVCNRCQNFTDEFTDMFTMAKDIK